MELENKHNEGFPNEKGGGGHQCTRRVCVLTLIGMREPLLTAPC